MFGYKRAAPCDGFSDIHGKTSNGSTHSIYEKTLDLLLAGAQSSGTHKEQNGSSQAKLTDMGVLQSANSMHKAVVSDQRFSQLSQRNSCKLCSFNRYASSSCSHCMKSVCNACCRMCNGCEEAYCTYCSILNFEERDDRVFCFDCNAKDLKRRM